mmetsp:Transcript_31176/g.38513  ORF Transcript_31176/g.38513 Transcript_31176/m.38513 type:complete len:94 (-) Transcript_31176:53-334(-)
MCGTIVTMQDRQRGFTAISYGKTLVSSVKENREIRMNCVHTLNRNNVKCNNTPNLRLFLIRRAIMKSSYYRYSIGQNKKNDHEPSLLESKHWG